MQEYVVLWNYKPRRSTSLLLRPGDKLTSVGGYLPQDVLIRVVRDNGEVIKSIAPVFLDMYTAEIRAGEPEIEVKSGQELQLVIGKGHHEDVPREFAFDLCVLKVT